jgi:chromosome segregation ATPase
MGEWFSASSIITLAAALVAVAVAWGNLRATVTQQARQHALEREELRAINRRLRTDIDELRTRNGSASVERRLGELRGRLDHRDRVAEEGLQRLSRAEGNIDSLKTRQDENTRRLDSLAPRARSTRT